MRAPLTYSISDCQKSLTDEFPELSDDLRDQAGLLHMQLSSLALLTQEAKGRADWHTYDRCVAFVDRHLRNADPVLEDAIYVAYLEHIDFDGPRGPNAWHQLSPDLQAAWSRIAKANARRIALPHRKARRGH